MSNLTRFRTHKVVSALPGTLEPNAVYFVRAGAGFDLYCTDQTGSIAHQINYGVTPASLPAQVRAIEKSSSFLISGVTNGTYILDPGVAHALTILRVRNLRNAGASGSCTASFQNNGTNITGLNTLSVTTTALGNQAGSSNNIIAVGNSLSLVISGATAALNLVFNIDYTEA